MEKIIKKFLFLCCLTSCAAQHQMMNCQAFKKIPEGSCFQEVVNKYGEPYDVVWLRNGIKEYRYIQRTKLGSCSEQQIHYILTVSEEGQIIDKRADTFLSNDSLRIQ